MFTNAKIWRQRSKKLDQFNGDQSGFKGIIKLNHFQEKIKIAVVAYDSLGEGRIYLIIAENIAKNKFEVTCFSDPLSLLLNWVVNFQRLIYPPVHKFDGVSQAYGLILMSPTSFFH